MASKIVKGRARKSASNSQKPGIKADAAEILNDRAARLAGVSQVLRDLPLEGDPSNITHLIAAVVDEINERISEIAFALQR